MTLSHLILHLFISHNIPVHLERTSATIRGAPTPADQNIQFNDCSVNIDFYRLDVHISGSAGFCKFRPVLSIWIDNSFEKF